MGSAPHEHSGSASPSKPPRTASEIALLPLPPPRRTRTRQRKHSGALWLRCSVLIFHLLPKVQSFARLWRRRGSTARRGCSASALPLGWGSSRAGRSSSASPLRCPGMSLSSSAGHLCARACVRACACARACACVYLRVLAAEVEVCDRHILHLDPKL